MEPVVETYMEVPLKFIEKSNGISMDLGESTLKILYIHKNDWHKIDKEKQESVCLRAVTFSRNNFHEGLSYLKDRMSVTSNLSNMLVYTTGSGTSQLNKVIEEVLQIRACRHCIPMVSLLFLRALEYGQDMPLFTTFVIFRTCNILDEECLFAAFNYLLENSTIGEVVYDLDQTYVEKAVQINKLYGVMMTDYLTANKHMDKELGKAFELKDTPNPQTRPTPSDKVVTDIDDLYPYFLIVTGSNGGIFLGKKDGTYSFIHAFKHCGKVLLGIGSLLTRCKSFEELMSKANRGNMHTVHEYMEDIARDVEGSDNDTVYKSVSDATKDQGLDNPAFLFGKCIFKELENFKEEDLALSLVYTMVSSLVQSVHASLRAFPQVRHVFFCGGMTNHPLMRKMIVDEWLEQEMYSVGLFGLKKYTDTHFVRCGSYLEALGALLKCEPKFNIPKSS